MNTLAEAKFVIYGLQCTCHSQDGICYVGRTIQGARARFNKHRHRAKTGSHYHVYNWMRKHGIDNIRYEILDVAKKQEELPHLEEAWISIFPEGQLYNLQPIANGIQKHSDETRKKISRANKGRKVTREWIESMRAVNTGRKLTVEHRAKLSESHRRHNLSEETLAKLSAASRGSNSGATRLHESDVEQIIQMLKDGVMQKDIAAKFGISQQAVSAIRNNRTWKHVNR